MNSSPKLLIESKIEDEDNCICMINKNTVFYNAIKTADDYVRYHGKDYHSFIQFWRDSTGCTKANVMCTNLNCPNRDEDYELQGGHIVLTKPKGSIKAGEKCYIVPLCPKCNHPDNKDVMYFRNTMEVPEIIWGNV